MASATVSTKEAEKQLAELQPQPAETKEPPRGTVPGSHPLKCVEDDAQALLRYQGANAPGAAPEEGLWHRTAYGAPVFVPGDKYPASAPRASSARGE